MKKLIWCSLLVLSTFIAPKLYADDGNRLLEMCTTAVRYLDDNSIAMDSSQNLEFGICLGFLEGAVNGMDAGMSRTENKAFCLPTARGISNGQKVRIVVAYLQKNPALLHEDRLALVARAFIDAYPCSD
jgi:hypothetical protein